MNNFQYFDIDLAINDNREIRGIILKNKIKMVLISDKDINRSICSIGVGAGYLQDKFEGTAHFLEHLVFMGSEKYPERNEYTSYIQVCGGTYNAFTSDNMTIYYLELDTSFLKKGIEMLSWFFKKPILNMEHINSEKEIIDSEHNKNLHDDNWIINNLFNNFMDPNSKFNKFGTGNFESLKNITQKDIMDFHNKYYTTCNMNVCIIDTKNIDEMIKDYVHFFDDIGCKIYEGKEDRFIKEKIKLIDDNLIIFKSVSEYNFLNIYLVFKANQKNQLEYQLLNFINWLIGTEYINSLSYYLKENDLVNYINNSIDYLLDNEIILCIKAIMNEPNKDKINILTNVVNNLLNKINNLTEPNFRELYESFQKIKLLNCLYSDNNKSVDTALEIIDNLINSETHMAILRNYIVPKYTISTFKKFKSLLNNIVIKMITNINFLNRDNWKKSKWYNTPYLITEYKFKDLEIKNNFELMNIIGIKNFSIKTDLINKNLKKNTYPKLVLSDNLLKRQIYYLEYNKYNRPIANVSLIRYNYNLNTKTNKLSLELYKNICKSLINYYIEVMKDYKMYFNMIIKNDFFIYNFNGLNYEINNYIFELLKYIHPDTIFNNPATEIYFIKNIRDIKQNIINSKYDSPYIKTLYTQELLFENEMLPLEELEYFNKLTFKKFKDDMIECFKYQSEIFIIIGIPNFNLNQDNKNYIINQNIDFLINALSIDPSKYLIENNNSITNDSYKLSYKFGSKEINKKDKNNCLLQNFIIYKIPVKYSDSKNNLTLKSIKDIIKHKIICQMLTDIIYEPLFDKLRTEDKLGYVIKCDNSIKNLGDEVVIIIYYVVQSLYSIEKLKSSINNFNKFIKKDIFKNKNNYLEKFNSLKKSKELLLEKPYIDLIEEVTIYLQSFIEKFNIFDINKLMLEVIKTIQFHDFINGIKIITNTENTPNYIILNSNS